MKIADVPNTPNRMNVFRSACIPAPPPESEPAIVSAITRGVSAMKRKMRRVITRRISIFSDSRLSAKRAASARAATRGCAA